MNEIKCYIEDHYKINHSQVSDLARTTFATVGNLFEGKHVCAWCITRLSLVADAYGYSQIGTIRGNITNVDVKL